MDIKFLTQENEIQKLYSKFGLVVPVGDLETGKVPAIQPLPSTSTQTSITFNYNIISGSDVYMISAGVWRWEDVAEEYDPENQNPDPNCPGSDYGCTPPLQYFDIPAQKGVVSIEVTDLEYNSGPYLCCILVANESGSIAVYSKADLVQYTDWATANEVLEGNKFIGEDGQEAVGTYIAPEPVLGTLNVTENGTYTPDEGVDGYSEVTVDVSTGASNYLELQLEPAWEDAFHNKFPFGGYILLNLNDLTIPEGGTYSGNTPKDCVADIEFIKCYLDAQHSDSFSVYCSAYNGILNEPRQIGNAFITSNDTVIIPCCAGSFDVDPDTGEQTIPQYDFIPCGQTELTGDFEVYAVKDVDMNTGSPMYEVVATGTYFIPATQSC